MPIAEVNGQRLHYERHGDGEPLLCIMGLSADHTAWMLQVPAFSERFDTVIFDNRDVGQSSQADAEYETADMAADALALADELGLDGFHLLGVSMGGAIAQELALAAPERVRTLTLAVSFAGAGRYGPEKARSWSKQFERSSREERIDELLLLTLSESFFEHEEAVQFARQLLLANPNPQTAEAFSRQLHASGRHETRDRLGTLKMPVHVIGAEHDMLVPAWKSKEIAALIPGSKLTVIEGAAHGVPMERPDLFNPAVVDFIVEHAGAPVS